MGTATRGWFLCALLLVALFAPGCTARLGDFTMISNKLVKLDKVDLDSLPTRKNVVGEDIRLVELLFLPLFWNQPTIEGAVDDTLEKGGGDLITDAILTQKSTFFLLGRTAGFQVKGDVVVTRTGDTR